MNTLNKYDLKQLLLVKKKIFLFKNEKINLFELVCDLGGILNAVESVDSLWKADFQREINTLEMVYDSIEDGSILRWEEDSKKVTCDSVLALKKMTLSLIGKYVQSPDLSISESAVALDNNWLMCPKCTGEWESTSTEAMIICSKCESALHNPRYRAEMTNT